MAIKKVKKQKKNSNPAILAIKTNTIAKKKSKPKIKIQSSYLFELQ